ncbi:MAG: substrate-binding domain-containing protein, partial [Tepidisphaeraceae bacterium]
SLNRGAPAWRFDGAILIQAPRPDLVVDLDKRRVPYVGVNERVSNALANVLADDAMGMTHALEHLAQLGHTRVAYANARGTYLDHYSVAERHAALMSVAMSNDIKIVGGHDAPFVAGKQFITQSVIDQKATAIISYDHRIAVEIVGAAASMKLSIPKDVSLVCFNDVFPVAQMHPPITSVAVSGTEMGRIGGELLLNSLRSSEAAVPKEIRVAENLIIRSSTGAPKA